jgi:hypothetical protein
MIPDIDVDKEFMMMASDGIIVFSEKAEPKPKDRERMELEPTKVRLISSSLRKVRKRVFDF